MWANTPPAASGRVETRPSCNGIAMGGKASPKRTTLAFLSWKVTLKWSQWYHQDISRLTCSHMIYIYIYQWYWFNGRLSLFQLVSICFNLFLKLHHLHTRAVRIPCEEDSRNFRNVITRLCLCHLCSMFLRGSIAKNTAKHTSRFQQNAKEKNTSTAKTTSTKYADSKTHFLGYTACLPNSCLPNIEIHLRMPHLFGALTHWTKNVIPPFPRFPTVPVQCHGKYWQGTTNRHNCNMARSFQLPLLPGLPQWEGAPRSSSNSSPTRHRFH